MRIVLFLLLLMAGCSASPPPARQAPPVMVDVGAPGPPDREVPKTSEPTPRDDETANGVGSRAPKIAGVYVTGDGPRDLLEARGKVSVVHFWATWCEPCKKSLPELGALVARHGTHVAVVGVAVDDADDTRADELRTFVAETGARFTIVWDKDRSAAQRYMPPKVPSTYVMDREGIIRHVHGGYDSDTGQGIAAEVAALVMGH